MPDGDDDDDDDLSALLALQQCIIIDTITKTVTVCLHVLFQCIKYK